MPVRYRFSDPTEAEDIRWPPEDAGGGGDAQPFFSEDWDNGQKNNANGFSWSGGPQVVDEGISFTGDYALRFVYGPDADGEDSAPEQRFSLGRDMTAVWFEYQLYVPANFIHRSQAYLGQTFNNKFFRVWQGPAGNDSQAIFSVTTEYWRNNDTESRLEMIAEQTGGSTTEVAADPFIGSTGPITIGEWNQIRMGYQTASGLGQEDGYWKLWVDGVLVGHLLDFEFWNQAGLDNTYIQSGYILGWSNSGFTEATTFYVDAFKAYDENPGWSD
jgi:hypothetical protein